MIQNQQEVIGKLESNSGEASEEQQAKINKVHVPGVIIQPSSWRKVKDYKNGNKGKKHSSPDPNG